MVRRYEPEEKGRGIKLAYWLAVLGVAVLWIVAYRMYFNRYEYLHPDVTWAVPGVDSEVVTSDGLLLWTENTITAPFAGRVSYPQGAGPVRVGSGAQIIKLSSGGNVRYIKAPQQGYFVAGYDGSEGKWRYSDIWPGKGPLPDTAKIKMLHDGDEVQAGSVIGKIVPQPQDLRFIGYMKTAGTVDKQLKEQRLRVKMDSDDTISIAEIRVSTTMGDRIKFYITLPWFDPESVLSRRYRLIIEAGRTEGAMIPGISVLKRDSVTGVFRVRGSHVVFTPVEGRFIAGGNFLVTKGIYIGDAIVEDASSAKEGRIQLW